MVAAAVVVASQPHREVALVELVAAVTVVEQGKADALILAVEAVVAEAAQQLVQAVQA
jgi:hypothetical protein